MDEWGLARLIGYIGGAVAFWLFTRRSESRNAAPHDGFRRRVLRSPVALPVGHRFAGDQDADPPHGAALGDEQVDE